MTFIHLPPAWQLAESRATEESLYWNRRHFLKTIGGAGFGALLMGCKATSPTQNVDLEATFNLSKIQPITLNPNFRQVDRPLTSQILASQYNNFYEFGGGKSVWKEAQALPTENWQVEVTGLVNKPQIYDLDKIKKTFPIEERIYRFRCVEAWSMVLPWVGFAMNKLIAAVEPKSTAKFIRFTSFYDKDITHGPGFSLGYLPWPYTESLRLDEMANELAFFAIGIYGKELPKQHGAPIRCVLPWKYGFKGAKSVVKIEFVESQPATYWHTLVPNEYDFEANVNPTKPHPRWSQATERFIGQGTKLEWEMKETLPYNGYGEYVASLYG